MNDKQRIEALGGVKAVSQYLGISYQRVYNWITRGIPSKVKINSPDLFLTDSPPSLNILIKERLNNERE